MSFESWMKGVSLTDAPLYFASQEVKDKINKLSDENDTLKAFENVQKVAGRGTASFQDLAQAFLDGKPSMAELDKLQRQTKATIFHALVNGTLLAFGFSQPRHVNDVPQNIPPDLFQWPHLNWNKNIIEGHGLRFEAIRIVHSKKLLAEQPKQPGRPSSKETILKAYEHLHRQGMVDLSDKRKAARLIRKHILEVMLGPDDDTRGFSLKTIEKYLREIS